MFSGANGDRFDDLTSDSNGTLWYNDCWTSEYKNDVMFEEALIH